MRSPLRIPVPSNSQCPGRVQIQSPDPLNGETVCAPISVASFGASSGRSAMYSFSLGRMPPYRPARVSTRFGAPRPDAEYGATKEQVLPDRNATFTPARTADRTGEDRGRLQ